MCDPSLGQGASTCGLNRGKAKGIKVYQHPKISPCREATCNPFTVSPPINPAEPRRANPISRRPVMEETGNCLSRFSWTSPYPFPRFSLSSPDLQPQQQQGKYLIWLGGRLSQPHSASEGRRPSRGRREWPSRWTLTSPIPAFSALSQLT